jgi:hypothetical protein
MKITIEQYEHTVTHEVPHNDVDLDEAIRMCEGLLKATGYCFSGNLEIVDEWTENDERESFRIVDEPNEPKIRVGDATITTYDEFGVKHETQINQE